MLLAIYLPSLYIKRYFLLEILKKQGHIQEKQKIFLRFSRLIKISGRKNLILLRARSNSFRCESDAEHQTGE